MFREWRCSCPKKARNGPKKLVPPQQTRYFTVNVGISDTWSTDSLVKIIWFIFCKYQEFGMSTVFPLLLDTGSGSSQATFNISSFSGSGDNMSSLGVLSASSSTSFFSAEEVFTASHDLLYNPFVPL